MDVCDVSYIGIKKEHVKSYQRQLDDVSDIKMWIV
jgi:hypothetical protein